MLRTVSLSLIGAFIALSLNPTIGRGQSLWARRKPDKVFLFYDTQARRTGDTLTIIVRENTDVDNKDRRALDKDSEAGFFFDTSETNSFDVASNSNRAFNGSSQYKVEQELSDRITVTVLDVLPNGNMVVGGKRSRQVSGEMRTLLVSGIVRPIDVRPDNSVESQFVAAFRISYDGNGPESSFANQGWLGRFVNRLWPF